jgi:hypothetical protein
MNAREPRNEIAVRIAEPGFALEPKGRRKGETHSRLISVYFEVL